MRSMAVLVLVATAMPLASLTFAASPTRGVQVVADEAHRRVDITIDGQPFTSYIWPASLKSQFSIRLSPMTGSLSLAAFRSNRSRESVSITRITPACGSTMAMPTASISGTTPMPSSRKVAPKWVPLNLGRFCLPGAVPTLVNLLLNPPGLLERTSRSLIRQRAIFFLAANKHVSSIR